MIEFNCTVGTLNETTFLEGNKIRKKIKNYVNFI